MFKDANVSEGIEQVLPFQASRRNPYTVIASSQDLAVVLIHSDPLYDVLWTKDAVTKWLSGSLIPKLRLPSVFVILYLVSSDAQADAARDHVYSQFGCTNVFAVSIILVDHFVPLRLNSCIRFPEWNVLRLTISLPVSACDFV